MISKLFLVLFMSSSIMAQAAGGVNGGGGFQSTVHAAQLNKIVAAFVDSMREFIDKLEKKNAWLLHLNERYPNEALNRLINIHPDLWKLGLQKVENFEVDENLPRTHFVHYNRESQKIVFSYKFTENNYKASFGTIFRELLVTSLKSIGIQDSALFSEIQNEFSLYGLSHFYSNFKYWEAFLFDVKLQDCGTMGSIEQKIKNCQMAGAGSKTGNLQLVYQKYGDALYFYHKSLKLLVGWGGQLENYENLPSYSPSWAKSSCEKMDLGKKVLIKGRLPTPEEMLQVNSDLLKDPSLAQNRYFGEPEGNHTGWIHVYPTSDEEVFVSAQDGLVRVENKLFKKEHYERFTSYAVQNVQGQKIEKAIAQIKYICVADATFKTGVAP